MARVSSYKKNFLILCDFYFGWKTGLFHLHYIVQYCVLLTKKHVVTLNENSQERLKIIHTNYTKWLEFRVDTFLVLFTPALNDVIFRVRRKKSQKYG